MKCLVLGHSGAMLLKFFWSGVVCFFSMSAAHADGINLHQLYPAKNTRFLSVESPTLSPAVEDLVHLGLGDDYGKYYRDYYERIYLELNFDYLAVPLVNVDSATGNRASRIVDSISSTNFSAGYQLNQRIAVFGEMAAHRIQIVDTQGFKTPISTKMGDSRVIVKWLVNPPNDAERNWTFAIIPEITFPTGSPEYFTGNGSTGYGINLSAENEAGKLIMSGNLGFRYAEKATYGPIDYRKQFPFALGLLYRWSDHMGWLGEMNGSIAYTSSEFQNHFELFTGPRWRAAKDWTLLAGAGTGHFKSDMANDFRAILQIKFTPFFNRKPAVEAERVIPSLALAKPAPVIETKEFCELGNVVFPVGKATLSEDAKRKIAHFSKRVLQTNKKPLLLRVQVQGHSSPEGNPSKNAELAVARAELVKAYLLAQGVGNEKVVVRGYNASVGPRGNFQTEKERWNAWRRAELFCEYQK